MSTYENAVETPKLPNATYKFESAVLHDEYPEPQMQLSCDAVDGVAAKRVEAANTDAETPRDHGCSMAGIAQIEKPWTASEPFATQSCHDSH